MLTTRSVRQLQSREKPYLKWDSGGLAIRVNPKGTKTWTYIYRDGSRVRWVSLGRFPALGVADARRHHAQALKAREEQRDPWNLAVAAKQADREAPTVSELVELFVEKYSRPRKKTWRDDQRILRKELSKRWRDRKARDITRRDIIELLDEVAKRGKGVMANRTFAVSRKMFNWAVSRDILTTSPCFQVTKPVQESTRDRVLSDKDIRAFYNKLPETEMGEQLRLALMLMMVTAQRPGEVASAAWCEFDLKGRWWTIPAERSKNNLSHKVPLTKQALVILKRAKELLPESEWVFPSPTDEAATRPLSLARTVRKNLSVFEIDPFTPHDIRRTVASNLTSMGILRLVVAKILNHSERGITAVYDRWGYDREKREALELWSKRLNKILKEKDRGKSKGIG